MTSLDVRRELRALCAATTLTGLTGLTGCGQASGDARPEESSPLLVASKAEVKAPDLARATADPEELVRAILLPHRSTARRLGAHRFRGEHRLRVSEHGKEIESLDETTAVELAANGDLHALYTNTRSYGRELYAVGGTIWVRPRWGKFHMRPPASPDEAARVADEIYGTLAADLELVGFSLKVTDGGAAEVAGRAAKKLRLALGPPRKKPAEADATRKWRDAVTVQALDGELALDAETGTLLDGRLATRVTFQREGRALEMLLESKHAVSDVGASISVAAPPEAESVTTPTRSHEFEERQQLLEGIAPPAPKAPVPGGEGPR
jgi:hypothetical protein